jgi:hypothetical protein
MEGMVLNFDYSTQRVGAKTNDYTPIVLVLYVNRKNKTIEGINLNYLVLSKVKKIFKLTESRLQTDIQRDEKVVGVSKDFTRVPISAFRKRSQITPERYYKQVIKADPDFGKAYRSYKLDNITAAQVVDLKEDIMK